MGWTMHSPVIDQFLAAIDPLAFQDVLELGTLRWEVDKPTHHKEWAPATATYTMADIGPGLDVDVVADAHDLKPFVDGSFDVLIACSLLEHVERPWLVLQAMARVLRPGGVLFIDTHQTFPLHGYPNDFFRFSTQALAVLAEDAGLEVVAAEHCFPAKITPLVKVPVWNDAAEAYLNVQMYARKPL